jgi:C2 domain
VFAVAGFEKKREFKKREKKKREERRREKNFRREERVKMSAARYSSGTMTMMRPPTCAQIHAKIKEVGVEILGAEDLFNADWKPNSKDESDPYVKLMARVGSSWSQVGKTKVVQNSLNPTWDKHFLIKADKVEAIRMEVWDQDRFSRNDYLGEMEMSVEEFTRDARVHFSKPLTHDPGRKIQRKPQGLIKFNIVVFLDSGVLEEYATKLVNAPDCGNGLFSQAITTSGQTPSMGHESGGRLIVDLVSAGASVPPTALHDFVTHWPDEDPSKVIAALIKGAGLEADDVSWASGRGCGAPEVERPLIVALRLKKYTLARELVFGGASTEGNFEGKRIMTYFAQR